MPSQVPVSLHRAAPLRLGPEESRGLAGFALKARVILAWGEAPGQPAERIGGLKARAKRISANPTNQSPPTNMGLQPRAFSSPLRFRREDITTLSCPRLPHRLRHVARHRLTKMRINFVRDRHHLSQQYAEVDARQTSRPPKQIKSNNKSYMLFHPGKICAICANPR